MNKIKAKVTDIKSSKDLYHIFLGSKAGNLGLVMLSCEFKVGDELEACFKESSVAVMKDKTEKISYSNQIKVEITEVYFGEILTKIVAKSDECILTSVITTNSAKRLELKKGDKVVFLVKATDMFVM